MILEMGVWVFCFHGGASVFGFVGSGFLSCGWFLPGSIGRMRGLGTRS